MTYDLIKAELSAPDFGPEGMFAALRGAARLANNPATLAQGRDLVIRLLSKASLCGQFERRILISLVRTVGLFPYMKEYLALAEDDDLLAYQFHYMKELDVVFHGLQARIYDLLLSGSNVVLSASTSAGKSLLIDAMIASEKFRKVVIILPTLALIDETRRRLSARFGERRQIVTQPSQQAAAGSKSVYILTQERARKRDDLDDVDFFVIDEFYKLDIRKVDDGDTRRAIELNLCFHKLAAKGAQFYLLGPNIHAIRGLERHEVHFIPSGFATVAVDIVHHDMSSSKPERLEKLIEILRCLPSALLRPFRGFREGRISGSSQPFRSADETEIRAGESTGRAGREGHPPSDAAAVLGRREDPHRAGRRTRRGEHRRAVPARGDRFVDVLRLVEGVPRRRQAPSLR